MLEKTNLLGAIVAVAFFVSASLVFIFRLLGKPQFGHWIGYNEKLTQLAAVDPSGFPWPEALVT